MSDEYSELVLACESWQEAQRLTDALLASDLVKAVESLESQPGRWWEQSFPQRYRVRLIVQTLEHDVAAVKQEIVRLRRAVGVPPHDISLAHLSAEVVKWLHLATEVKIVRPGR
ncbi:MAG TPA: hypothetical protein VFL85_01195 [Candidatus Saccharimonadales bacterium]|nr:hypothetical protein [Candidatus Saccharimonadales bacterium]